MYKSSSDPSKETYTYEKSRSYKPDRSSGRRHEWSHSRNKSSSGYHKSDRSSSPPSDSARGLTLSVDKKGKVQESRKDDQKKSSQDSECGAGHSSKEGHSRDHRRHRTSDRHIRNLDTKEDKKSSSTHQPERSGKSSKERKDERLKDHQRKEDRRQEGSSRKCKIGKSSDPRRKSLGESNEELHQAKATDCRKAREEKTQEPLKTSCEETRSSGQKNLVEENSPNRKLCFMETLNLTISPTKKPRSVIKTHQNSAEDRELEAVETEQDLDENYQPTMEDMCVVDEVNCSILEPEQDDVAAKSPDTTAILKSEEKERRESVEESHMKDESCSELSQVQSVETTLGNRKSIDITLSQVDVPNESKSPVNLRPSDVELSEMSVDKTNVVLMKKLDTAVSKDCIGRGPSKGLKSNVLAKVKPGEASKQAVAVAKPAEVVLSVSPKCTQPANVAPKCFPKSSEKENKAAKSVGNKNQQSPNGIITPAESQNEGVTSASCPGKDKDVEAVSSTISLDSLPKEGLSLPEAIYILTQTSEEANDSCQQQSSTTSSVAVPKVSSTTGEVAAVPPKLGDLTLTPKKSSVSVKAQGSHFETPSPLALLHDEDSMMRTLSGLKRIPDAISPLRSPIQTSKRSHHHSVHTKPGHVKSLERGRVRSYNDLLW